MDAVRVGAVFRAVRLRRRLRLADVATAAGVSVATVWRVERGHVESMSVGVLLRVAAALEIRLDWAARWRGGELDRMLNAGHAAMHEAIARTFAGTGWQTAPEVSFSIFGERGVVDVLAFHPASGSLLVVELKTELVDVQALIGAVDRYRRLAPAIARERGWDPSSVSCWVLLRDTATNHRRLAEHATVLRSAFPVDGRRMRSWIARPAGSVAALSFLSDSPARKISGTTAGVRRVRLRTSSVATAANRRRFSTDEKLTGTLARNRR